MKKKKSISETFPMFFLSPCCFFLSVYWLPDWCFPRIHHNQTSYLSSNIASVSETHDLTQYLQLPPPVRSLVILLITYIFVCVCVCVCVCVSPGPVDASVQAKCSPCMASPCQNQGVCKVDHTQLFTCTCKTGFTVCVCVCVCLSVVCVCVCVCACACREARVIKLVNLLVCFCLMT